MKCKIENYCGRLTINIDNQHFLPLAFKTFRAEDKNISDFYDAGIRLFNIVTGSIKSAIDLPYSTFGETWLDDYLYDFSPIDAQFDLFIKQAPDAYISVMIQLDTRQWWLDKYKNYPHSFQKLAQMEADPLWRDAAAQYLQAALSHIEEKYGEKVFGYFLLCGSTTEWFSDGSHEEPSILAEQAFKKWVNDDTVQIPEAKKRETPEDVVFLTENADKELIDYRKFEAWQRSDTIEFFAKKAQDVLKHQKLLGIYYGYIFELEGKRLWETGHLDYERIFLSKDIDMISSPMSYGFRRQDSSSEMMVTGSTLTMHNKIYFLEHDQTTCIVPDIIDGQYFVHPDKAKTITEDINLLRRDFLLAFSNGIAMWWFDMFGGWWYDEQFMTEIKNMISISNRFLNTEFKNESEIAVIADPESLYYINKNSLLNNDLLFDQRRELSYMGAPYDLFSACDIKDIDMQKYKLFVFLSSFKKDSQLIDFVNNLRQNKKAMVFSYACNLVGENINLDGMNNLLGFDVDFNDCKETTAKFDDFEHSTKTETDCFCVVGDAASLAHYKNSGKCAIAFKENGYLTAFSGLATISEKTLRIIAEKAGVHLYSKTNDTLVYANNIGLGIYHRTEGDAEIILQKDDTYVDLFDGKEYSSNNKILNVPYENNRAKLLVKKTYCNF